MSSRWQAEQVTILLLRKNITNYWEYISNKARKQSEFVKTIKSAISRLEMLRNLSLCFLLLVSAFNHIRKQKAHTHTHTHKTHTHTHTQACMFMEAETLQENSRHGVSR